jgi:hypothetical protein
MTEITKVDGRKNNGRNLKGRPKGIKNKTTIFKEAIREGFEEKLMKDGMKVVDAVVAKAIEGDMTAAKLLLDRILPTSKAIDLDQLEKSKGVSISIQIGDLQEPQAIDAEVIEVVEEDDS